MQLSTSDQVLSRTSMLATNSVSHTIISSVDPYLDITCIHQHTGLDHILNFFFCQVRYG